MNNQYALNQEAYTWSNILLWGIFNGHCQAAKASVSWKDKIVHTLIAVIEIFPFIGQIASLFEKIIVTEAVKERPKPKSLQEKKIVVHDTELKKGTPVEKTAEKVLQSNTVIHERNHAPVVAKKDIKSIETDPKPIQEEISQPFGNIAPRLTQDDLKDPRVELKSEFTDEVVKNALKADYFRMILDPPYHNSREERKSWRAKLGADSVFMGKVDEASKVWFCCPDSQKPRLMRGQKRLEAYLEKHGIKDIVIPRIIEAQFGNYDLVFVERMVPESASKPFDYIESCLERDNSLPAYGTINGWNSWYREHYQSLDRKITDLANLALEVPFLSGLPVFRTLDDIIKNQVITPYNGKLVLNLTRDGVWFPSEVRDDAERKYYVALNLVMLFPLHYDLIEKLYIESLEKPEEVVEESVALDTKVPSDQEELRVYANDMYPYELYHGDPPLEEKRIDFLQATRDNVLRLFRN